MFSAAPAVGAAAVSAGGGVLCVRSPRCTTT
jgi:hypothetical protein